METKEQEIKRLVEENINFKEYIKLVKKSKVIELGLTQAVLKNIEYNEHKIEDLEKQKFIEAQSKIIYGTKDKVLVWNGKELKELEG